MKVLRSTYILFVLICSCFIGSVSFASPVKVLKYDSAIVKTVTPDKELEEEVFSQVDLSFAKEKEDKDISLWDRFWDWVLNLIFGKADYEDKITLQRVFLWVFVIAGLIVVIWLLTRTEFTSFLRGNTKNAEFNFSDVEEDISGIDFNARIEKAIRENDLRLAIRWLYLKQLFLLNDKNAISYQPYKTNIDYTIELAKMPYQKSFVAISRVYDYVWYGKYTIDQVKYQDFEKEFKEFERSLNV